MKNKNSFAVLLMLVVCVTFMLVGCNNAPTGGGGSNANEDTHTYYTVAFDSKGGSAVESQRIMAGNPVARSALPVYEGYDFTGWYKDEAATNNLWDFEADRVDSDMTLYAGWKSAPDGEQSNVLTAYFSATGNTENIANTIAEIVGGDTYGITPAVPYTSADLNYNTDCRANREQNDPTCRPDIAGGVENMKDYDIVFIGYPIWWGQAPKIIYTFLESYDFSGKTIVTFCTSGSSGIGSSSANLHSSAPAAVWKDGQRFSGGASRSTVETWVNGLGLNIQKEREMKISVKSNDIEIIYRLNNSKAAKDLYAQMPLTIEVRPYSNNEIVFYPEKLDISDAPLAEGGAGILDYYAPWGDVVLFYGPFGVNGSLFELGKIVSGAENIENLSGTVTVTAC